GEARAEPRLRRPARARAGGRRSRLRFVAVDARLPRGRGGLRRETAAQVRRPLAALPGEAGGEDRLVVGRDELQITDRQTGPAEQIERPRERGERDSDLELVAVLRRQVDAENRRDEEVNLGVLAAPRLECPVSRTDRVDVGRLRQLQLAADV